jgi:eukaryotic-like serine/threonine-protein kinase
MNDATDRWHRIEELCQRALDLPAHERAKWLDRSCGDDHALRREVENLLAHEHAGARFLETSVEPVVSAVMLPSLAGRRVGVFEVGALLGAGGMGEVYRARDTLLQREVALKLLPRHVASDPEWLARFKREAQTLASLNHPHVAAIYGFEEAEAMQALVLELVEGPTLAERIARGPIPVDEALLLARQIAEGLEAAHEAGIVHRDLKPSNIQLRADGVAKVLDFGIARALDEVPVGGATPVAPPAPSGDTTRGVLGTAAYMSPERAKGLPADRRADIWAFGAVLFEMLSGERAFGGDNVADTLAAVRRAEPPWAALPGDTPPSVRRLLQRCLNKDPKQRLQHIGDARLELAEIDRQLPPETFSSRPGARVMPLFAAALAGAATIALAFWISTPPPEPTPVTRFSVQAPPGTTILLTRGPIALSPDGRTLVYVIGRAEPQLVQRRLGEATSEPLRGGQGGIAPFFSPDGAWIAFFSTDGKLKKIPAGGGDPITISDAPPNARGAWGDDGSIIVARTHLYKVPASGGTLETLVEARADEQFGAPELLPGSRVALVRARIPPNVGHIEAVELDTGARRVLVDGTTPRLATTGELLFGRDGRLWTVAFDARRLVIEGSPVPVVESVRRADDGEAVFAVARDGSLAYAPAPGPAGSSLGWLDASGTWTPVLTDELQLAYPRLSPDGARVAASVLDEASNDVWVFDLTRGSRTRLTTTGSNRRTVWSPDGRNIAFFHLPESAQVGEAQDLYVVSSTGGTPTRVLERPGHQWPDAWSPDGRSLIFEDSSSGSSRDLWLLPFGEQPRPLIVTQFNERAAAPSPDGKWLAFVSDESGRSEVYVQRLPELGQKIPVSTAGGLQPVWSRDGRELYYRDGDSLLAVRIELDPLRASVPREIIEMPAELYNLDTFVADYDVAADGRFIVVRRDEPREVYVVLNWTQELARALKR